MNRIVTKKSKRRSTATAAVDKSSAQSLDCVESNPVSRNTKNINQPGSERNTPKDSTSTSFRLTAEENKRILQIVESIAKITSHYELFLLLQNDVQFFIPHKILIAAWGDFQGSKPTLDVISAIEGVRTGELNGCGVEQLLQDVFTRWVAGGRRPMLLNDAAAEPITKSACKCALHSSMQQMRSVMVHGIRNERDGLDSVYLTLNPVSLANRQNLERLFFVVDSILTQIDVGFGKVAALNFAGVTADQHVLLTTGNLSPREQEIVRWITKGKTNAEIAAALGISSFTVKNHTQRIFRKLNVKNRTEAVTRFRHESPTAR